MKNWLRILLIVLSGCGIGFINGFLGGGGGVLVVAVFLALYALPQKNAHATALLVILPISLISALVYLLNGSVDWEYTLLRQSELSRGERRARCCSTGSAATSSSSYFPFCCSRRE